MYDFVMNKYYLADSGRKERINKATALGDSRINEALNITKKHIFLKKQKYIIYKNYELFKNKIINDTDNKIEKAIIFNNKNQIIF